MPPFDRQFRNGPPAANRFGTGSIVLSQHPPQRIYSEAPCVLSNAGLLHGHPIGGDQGRYSEICATKGILDFAFSPLEFVRNSVCGKLSVVNTRRGT